MPVSGLKIGFPVTKQRDQLFIYISRKKKGYKKPVGLNLTLNLPEGAIYNAYLTFFIENHYTLLKILLKIIQN